MKEFVELNDYLVDSNFLSQWHEDSEVAADNLNSALHAIYDKSDEDIEASRLVELLENACELLAQDEYLTEFESIEEVTDWVEQYLNDRL